MFKTKIWGCFGLFPLVFRSLAWSDPKIWDPKIPKELKPNALKERLSVFCYGCLQKTQQDNDDQRNRCEYKKRGRIASGGIKYPPCQDRGDKCRRRHEHDSRTADGAESFASEIAADADEDQGRGQSMGEAVKQQKKINGLH